MADPKILLVDWHAVGDGARAQLRELGYTVVRANDLDGIRHVQGAFPELTVRQFYKAHTMQSIGGLAQYDTQTFPQKVANDMARCAGIIADALIEEDLKHDAVRSETDPDNQGDADE